MFVKYECGCIGFAPDRGDDTAIVIDACDKGWSDEGYSMMRRPMTKLDRFNMDDRVPKEYERLDNETVDKIEREMAHQLGDGVQMRTIRRIINPRK
jgi:hypothetical protein